MSNSLPVSDKIQLVQEVGGAADQLVSLDDIVLPAGVVVTLPAGTCEFGITVQSDPGNTANIRVGGANTDAAHGFVIKPGLSVGFSVKKTELVKLYCASSGQVVHPVKS